MRVIKVCLKFLCDCGTVLRSGHVTVSTLRQAVLCAPGTVNGACCAEISLAARAGLAIYYSVANDWYGIVAFIIMWIIVTASCQIFCKHARTPRVFGVPLFPWVPSGEPGHHMLCL